LDRLVQRPVQGATHGVNAVGALDCFPCRFRRHQAHRDVNAANDTHALLCFHLSGYIRDQLSVAGIDLRASSAPPNVPIIQPAVAEMT